jgi:hypothetical protein
MEICLNTVPLEASLPSCVLTSAVSTMNMVIVQICEVVVAPDPFNIGI